MFAPLQDAQKLWQRNKDEEGGGGYLAWNWDSSIWGADVLLAAQTSDTKYGAEVCFQPHCAPPYLFLHPLQLRVQEVGVSVSGFRVYVRGLYSNKVTGSAMVHLEFELMKGHKVDGL